MAQCTNHILMIRPVQFGYNPETAGDNAFQHLDNSLTPHQIQNKALEEFENFTKKLKNVGIIVHIVQDTATPHTPDSIFPNNWISFHEDGIVCLYPMYAPTRRLERKSSVIAYIEKNFEIRTVLDLSRYENVGKYLEGTGSMVLDREHKIAYATISERTDEELFEKFCQFLGFRPISFHAEDETGKPIYHTNVMMCIADRYAVVCFESLKDLSEREVLQKELEVCGKVVIKLTHNQMNNFGGNMLQISGWEQGQQLGTGSNKFCVMSTKAFESLEAGQIAQIEKFDKIIHSDLRMVETNGGGSARCMMAEIFLPLKI